ncbi:MAG: amino acid adenylation domain-containing protein [Pyrinomonadaceae bacterium]|nr:amino acid adenylation domain-containing protein [Pyrinomonadaceae bacterium]
MTQTEIGLDAEGFRLSPVQKRLWTLAADGKENFYVCGIFKFNQNPNIPLLKQAIANVIKDQEILRTVLKTHRNFQFPLQLITERDEFVFEEKNAENLTETEQNALLQILIDENIKNEKLLSEDVKPLKILLLKQSENAATGIIFLHGYFCDYTGLVNLLGEISDTYLHLLRELEYSSEIPQFADISEWQNENLESAEAQSGREFWQDSRQYLPGQQNLPIEHKISSDCRIANIEGKLSDEIFAKLNAKSKEAEVGIEEWLLGCLAVMFSKYLDNSDVTFGVGFDGRHFPELKPSIGNLTKYLPVNAAPDSNQPFVELVRALKRKLEDSREWQDFFFWDLFSENLPGNSPFWSYCFDFYNLNEAPQADGNIFEILNIYHQLDRYKLCFSTLLQGENLDVSLKFDANFYSQNIADRIFAQFLKTVSITAENPQIKTGDVNFITEEERKFLVEEVNDNFVEYENTEFFHKSFEKQAESAPEAIAVVCEDRQITFRELNSKANQLAQHLISQGVKADDIIGLYLYPNIDFIVAMLGVFKSGAGYLPLDPANPLDRLAYMANDTKPKLIIRHEKLTGNDLGNNCPDLIIDQFSFGEADIPNPNAELTESNLAYVIYTSGSTGNPKGVVIHHRGLTNYLQWCLHNYKLDKGSGVPVHSSIGFDLSVTGIMAPLIAGKATYLLGENSNITSLIDLLETNNDFSFIKITPSHLEILRLLLSEKSLAAIKLMIVGGEALYGESFEVWKERNLDTVIINEYGPTETVVGCITFEKNAREIESGRVGIGKPIGNSAGYVLDERMRLLPLGVAGELYLGGVGVARGYWERRGLTAERFVPHPFSSVAGARLYRTGDLARFRADGQLEYLGRVDRQVKIRGYRVELGEIEGQLRSCPAVADAVVELRLDGRGEKQLVGYFVAAETGGAEIAGLQAYLRERLPEYMLPTRYLALEKIPLTRNGKVDRAALPALPAESGESAPRRTDADPVAELLVAVWEELLGVRVTDHAADFFAAGGHSLLATQLISRVRETFGVELELGAIFDHPQLAALAQLITKRLGAGGAEVLAPLEAVAGDAPLPLSYAQQRMWFLNQLEGTSGSYNIGFPLHVKGALDTAALGKAIDVIRGRHAILRTAFAVDEAGNLRQRIEARNTPARIAAVDLTQVAGEAAHAQARELAKQEMRTAFDLNGGELFRVLVMKLREDESVLMITMHHIISDGWSTGIFVRELAAAYRAALTGTSAGLPALPVQYADYAVWQRKHHSEEGLAGQLEYWKRQLGTDTPTLELPTDRPRPLMRSFNGAKQRIVLAAELTEGLREVSRRHQATLFMTLLSAFKVLLGKLSGQTDIAVGTPIANRRRRELEELIGFFVNTLVIRSRLKGGQSFGEYLAEVRQLTLAAYANQDIPFERLVEELRPERDLSRTPLFEAMFVMQNTPQEILELPGIELSGYEVEQETAKFDLTLTADEAANGELVVGMEYNTDIFDQLTIRSFLLSFQELLSELVDSIDKKLVDLEFLKGEPEFLQALRTNDFESEKNADEISANLATKWQTVRAEYVPLTTETERKIAKIWGDVLGVEEIGKNDDFFRLGGHSLLVIQAVTRINSAFETEISYRSLFEKPRLGDFAETIENSFAAPAVLRSEIPKRENLEFYPLSFGQKRLWFVHQLEPQSAVYNVSAGLLLKGEIQIELVNQAITSITDRQSILRTSFAVIESTPYQKILPTGKFEIETLDLSHLPESEQSESVKTEIAKRAEKPFNLTDGRLFRGVLLKLADDEHILQLTLHHIITDGLSMNILVKEFSETYTALKNQNVIRLPQLPVTYADYSLWQNEQFEDGTFTEKLAFWKKAIGTNPDQLNLPTDRKRPLILSGRGEKIQFSLPSNLKNEITYFCKNNEITSFMLFLSAFFVLLSKYSGQEEILVGTPVANRERVELENLVGFFVNTLVIRQEVSDDLSFADLVKRVKAYMISAFGNQDVPFEMLVEEIHPARNINRHPLFQVMFAYQHQTNEKLELPGLQITPVDSETSSSMFDLTFTVFETNSEFGVEIEYSTDLFIAETIERMGKHFEILLESVLKTPASRINKISLLKVNENNAELDRNKPVLEERNLTFQQMFEAQVEKTPENIALIQDNERLTYAGLNAEANRLAAYLRKKGIGAEKIVCIYQNRSIQMIISMLAVMKAGGAYIPLEPDVPIERVNTILTDIPNGFVISESSFIDLIEFDEEKKIDIEAESESIAQQPKENPNLPLSDENSAYLIYTSGSTGKPKGVMIPHRALCNHLLWMLDFQPFEPEQKFIVTTSLGFDASVWELHKPLISGATTVVINTKQQLDLEYLVSQINEHKVTVLQATPTFLDYLLKYPKFAGCESIREVFVGGEALPNELLERFHETFDRRLYNAYGPTETTVDASITKHEIDPEDEKITIGQAVSNKYIYILDKNMNLVPDGIQGEIYIGGAGLARGYFNRAAETAGNFLPDPFSSEAGKRIYRTGDYGRYLPNGNIEYLGRKDQQVKINGQRVELAEIESLLLRIPQINQAVVEIKKHNDREVLVGYLVAQDADRPGENEIRTILRKQIPEFMIPGIFQRLEELPLLSSGKVDRKKLPEIDRRKAESSAEFIAPQNEAQRKIVEIWEKVLGKKNIGISDNFFDSGGHSLLLIQVLDHLNREFEKKTTVLDLFIHTTVETLADFLTSENEEDKFGEVKQRTEQRQRNLARNKDIRQKRISGRNKLEN